LNFENHPKNILQLHHVRKIYESGPARVEVLTDISMKVPKGEIVVIMGPSGVGKSTLLNLVGTLDTPSGGKIYINGDDISQYTEQKLARFRNQHIGFIFQFHYLMSEFTALENVLIPRMIKGNDWKTEEQHAVNLLSEVGLEHRLHHRPNQLSGGEQQRVAIARAFMNRSKLILADEPTGDLDRHNSRALFNLILDLNQKHQQTFIIVTHDEMFAEKAHRIIHLRDGIIGQEEILKPNSV
jgi:lipoprotein-releasing system ATP-binding protein